MCGCCCRYPAALGAAALGGQGGCEPRGGRGTQSPDVLFQVGHDLAGDGAPGMVGADGVGSGSVPGEQSDAEPVTLAADRAVHGFSGDHCALTASTLLGRPRPGSEQ